MSFIKNPVLSTLQQMIGISPKPGPIVLDDTNVSLTLPMTPHVTRRSLAGIETGWFVGVFQNVHSAADAESSAIDPYEPGADAVPPYPMSVPQGFDVWLLGVSGLENGAGGGLTGAVFTMNPADRSQGWGRSDVGLPIVASPPLRLAFFDKMDADVTFGDPMMLTPGGQPFVKLGIRVPRGGVLGFNTESAAAATFRGILNIGLFPAGLGQDVTS